MVHKTNVNLNRESVSSFGSGKKTKMRETLTPGWDSSGVKDVARQRFLDFAKALRQAELSQSDFD